VLKAQQVQPEHKEQLDLKVFKEHKVQQVQQVHKVQ